MKTYLTYGFVLALGGALVTLALFFLGYHSDPQKLQTAQWIGLPLFIGITVVVLIMGTKARQAEVPLSEPFGYGRALGACVLIVLFASVFSVVVNFIYFQYLNPDFTEIMVQSQIEKLESQGADPARIEGTEKGMRMMMKPPIMAIFGFFQAMISGTAISLIVAAFLRRPAVNEVVAST
jgi:hypothetical protein